MTLLQDKIGRRDYLRGEWRKLYQSKDGNHSADDVAQLQSWNAEMDELGTVISQMQEIDAMAAKMLGPSGERKIVQDDGDTAASVDAFERVVKSIARTISENAQYKAFRERGSGTAVIEFDADLKTLISLSTVAPQNTALARIEPYPVETRTVADLIAPGTMNVGTLEYFQETTFTNAAVEVTEGNAKPEATLDWTLVTESAAKFAVWIPATSESLADIAWLESTIRERLMVMLSRREETQILNGNGTPPNLSGITDRANIQTQAKGSDPVFDAILKAMTLIQVNAFYDPTAIVMHPNDWRDLMLTRTTDGIYLLGNPGDPMAASRLWGLEVRSTTAQTENTAIVGAFRTAAQLFRRSGPTITVSTEHASYFIENKVAVMAEQREALAVYSPAAFCTVTGI